MKPFFSKTFFLSNYEKKKIGIFIFPSNHFFELRKNFESGSSVKNGKFARERAVLLLLLPPSPVSLSPLPLSPCRAYAAARWRGGVVGIARLHFPLAAVRFTCICLLLFISRLYTHETRINSQFLCNFWRPIDWYKPFCDTCRRFRDKAFFEKICKKMPFSQCSSHPGMF